MNSRSIPAPHALFVSGERSVTRADLERASLAAASGLRTLGVGPGDPVAFLLRNDFVFFEATYAARALGAYAVPLNWHLAPAEIAHVLRDCGARVLIAHDDLLRECGHIVQPDTTVLRVETPPEIRAAFRLSEHERQAHDDTLLWPRWLQGFEPLDDPAERAPESMFYTSGTTGLPKGVKRYAQDTQGAARQLATRDMIYGLTPGVRCIVPGPLYHGAPNQYGVRSSQLADRVVLMPRFDAEQLLALIEQHRITNAFIVPVMFHRLLKLPRAVRARYDVSSLQHVVTAGAPCPIETKAQMMDWFGPIVHEFYASTEMNYMTFCTPADARARPGTVGRAVEGARMAIYDDAGRQLTQGKVGEIYGRLEGAPDFTYHGREDERRAIERDGMVTGGDVGWFDDDGYLFLCDRRRDLVISGGVNIYPAEIESVLCSMPGVRDCAVFGIPDEEFGERLMAVVQPDDDEADIDADGVQRWLASRLAAFKVPKQIELRRELPRDDTGKIYKRRLRDPYWERVGKQI